MSKGSKVWLVTVAGMSAALVLAALVLPQSFRLTALSDIIQCLLLLSGTAAFFPLMLRSHGRIRLFWLLISLGSGFWLAYQLFWTYYEVILRRDVPDLCSWDAVLFLHFVPMMAALALRPQLQRDEYSTRVGHLDFALLLVWWFYLYVLMVMPWQYVVPDVPAYNRNLNAIYLAEKLFFLGSLVACWLVTRGEWRKLYAALFAMSLCYSASSTLANWAIARETYYSGSLYDIPLVAAMASLTWIALKTRVERPGPDAPEASTISGVWVARCGMIAVFSLPLFAAWSMSNPHVPSPIRIFRLALTLLAAFCLGVMVVVRQNMLDRELIRLLNHSRDSFDNLKRLQAQVLQSEKLASIGQLVGGAAHELNNPITAMLGYTDLLLNTALTPELQPQAAKIGQHVRRTKSLVASLISFARQAPAAKSHLDLNTLTRTALKLAQPQWQALEIDVRTQFDSSLPMVLGDSNQLLQVCLQLISNCLHMLSEQGGRRIRVTTERMGNICVLQITTDAIPTYRPDDSSATNLDKTLGLTACLGILQEHRGRISQERAVNGSLLLRVELPATDSAQASPKSAIQTGPWQSQPYA